jgi:hypothetical protein
MRNAATGASRTEEAEALAAKILSTGNFLAKMGLLHQKLPALDAARSVLRLSTTTIHASLCGQLFPNKVSTRFNHDPLGQNHLTS